MAIWLLLSYCIVVANAVYWDEHSYAGGSGGFGKYVVSRDTLNSPDGKSIIDELTENVDELYNLLQQGIAVDVFENKVQNLQAKAKNYLDENGINVPDADIIEALQEVSAGVNDSGIVTAIFEGPIEYESRRTVNCMLMLRALVEKAAEVKDSDYNRYIAAVEKIAGVLPLTLQHAGNGPHYQVIL
ncbi:uncharacterized protein LOC131956201 [Physella acuta]|uniref:uncharacterized protein LOC131956201 n=1 Tax=Physella acuta TaxID=109671 RepID=UPI0027DDDD04|nr:uncharacterized protein LOC131956201 [Physella acuta]